MTISYSLSIDRSSLSLTPLVLDGARGGSDIALLSYREPAMQTRLSLAPQSRLIHGDQLLGWSWQQTLHQFQVATIGAASESVSRGLIAGLVAAISQTSFTLTVSPNGAPDEVWDCQPGSLVPDSDRGPIDLRRHEPTWTCSIPAYPVRGV